MAKGDISKNTATKAKIIEIEEPVQSVTISDMHETRIVDLKEPDALNSLNRSMSNLIVMGSYKLRSGNEIVKCPKCKGTSRREYEGGLVNYRCGNCNGTGHVLAESVHNS